MDAIELGIVALKCLVIVAVLLTGFAYTTFLERKVIARMQQRLGPNRAGPFGLLQPAADGVKLIFKENITPVGVDRFVYFLAPIVSMVVAIMAFAVMPVADPITVTIGGQVREIRFQLADFNVALLYVLGITSLAVYGLVLAGWASNNKFALIGGLRSAAQMVSYELAMGVALVSVVLVVGSLSMNDIVDWQVAKGLPLIVLQPVAFGIYAITAIAETNRAPFDFPEAEQELVAGYHTEYTGMRFALFFMAEYINMITVSGLAATLFLGGHHLPFVERFTGNLPWFVDIGVFLAKVILALFLFIWIRATIPRLRYDRLMAFGWKVLLPISLANLALTAVVIAFLAR
ncbi:MAG: NADH-quinone oxidoreductase subunit NuoH [Ardenticatenales bacterium]|nr:NADH-quinone oxidoreductase subunit NuoH [Ardenticatenales bacterium]